MNKINLFITAISALCIAAGCGKDTTTTTPPVTTTPSTEDTSYVVSGLVDFKIGRLDSTILPMGFTHIAGKQEKVTFTITGMPEKSTATLDPASGVPTFATMLRIKTKFSKAGTYAVKIVGKNESGLEKSYTINMTVNDNIQCPAFLHDHNQNPKIFNQDLTKEIYSSNVFFKKEPAGSGYNYALSELYLEDYNQNMLKVTTNINYSIDCNTGAITIPKQTTGSYYHPNNVTTRSYEVSGTGTLNFDNDEFSISYKVVSPESNNFNYVLKGKLIY